MMMKCCETMNLSILMPLFIVVYAMIKQNNSNEYVSTLSHAKFNKLFRERQKCQDMLTKPKSIQKHNHVTKQ